MLKHELVSWATSNENESFWSHFDTQNICDMISITYSIVYAVIRILFPYGTYFNPHHYTCLDNPEEDCANYGHSSDDEIMAQTFKRQKLHEFMPMMHVIMLCLTLMQTIFFL